MHTTVSIARTARSTPPRISYQDIALEVLPRGFEVSLVFVGDTLSTRLNIERRNKAYTPNVLTFPLTDRSGEIFINLLQAKREAKRAGISYKEHVLHLFIHGLLHLKGMGHGATMERTECALVEKFS